MKKSDPSAMQPAQEQKGGSEELNISEMRPAQGGKTEESNVSERRPAQKERPRNQIYLKCDQRREDEV